MKTILIVDDLESVRFYHQLLLNQSGYRTLSARDGTEALAVLDRESVDLVMLDLLMPNMGGREFMDRARAMPRYDGLPILIITSEPRNDVAAALGDLGACDVLQKPILPEALISAVRQLLP